MTKICSYWGLRPQSHLWLCLLLLMMPWKMKSYIGMRNWESTKLWIEFCRSTSSITQRAWLIRGSGNSHESSQNLTCNPLIPNLSWNVSAGSLRACCVLWIACCTFQPDLFHLFLSVGFTFRLSESLFFEHRNVTVTKKKSGN